MKTKQQFFPWPFSMRLCSLYSISIAIIGTTFLPDLAAQDTSTKAEPPPRLINRINSDGTVTSENLPARVRTSADLPRTVRTADGERTTPPLTERAPARLSSNPSHPPSDIAPARFETTVYEVQMAEDRIDSLNVPTLEAKAATPQDLAKALEDYGKVKLLYKIDQTVNLYGENIRLGTQQPVVTASRMTAGGSAINSVTYQQVGLIVNITANLLPKESASKGLCVQMAVELAATYESGVEIAPQTKAVSTRSISLSHSETPRFGKPLVLLNVCVPGNEKSTPVAYVVRYVFREVQK